MWFRHFTFILFSISWCIGQVLITEIMYDLPGADSPNEFIELYNAGAYTVSLEGWQIRDRYTTDDLIDTVFGYQIPAHSYALILEGDHDPDSSIYHQLIPSGTVLLFVDDASIGNGLSGSDSLFLLDENGMIRETVGWTDVAPDGYSLERIRLSEPNVWHNWGVSRDSLGTPGFTNSLTPYQTDGQIISGSATVQPDTILPGTWCEISLAVTNAGMLPFSGVLEFRTQTALIGAINITAIQPLDTFHITHGWADFPSGYNPVYLNLLLNHDENDIDNHDSLTVHVRYPPATIILNEFLPAPNSEQVEFVECISQSSQPISLWNWSLQDAGTAIHRLPPVVLNPRQYLILTADSLFPIPDTSLLVRPEGWPTLNNSGDMVRLTDPFGTLIDSLLYSENWEIPTGKSAEKRLPDLPSQDRLNWSVCRDSIGHSAGYRNSIMPWPIDLALVGDSVVTTPPFPAAGADFQLRWMVRNVGREPVSGYTIRVITDSFQKDTLLTEPVAAGDFQDGTITISEHSGGFHPVRVDVLYPEDNQLSNNIFQDTIIVSFPAASVRLNEFMARPNNDQTEFVEWVAMDSVNMFRWSITDSRSSSRPFPPLILSPGSYAVIAADSILLPYVKHPATLIIDSTLPVLNNASDQIRILDPTGKCIDSLNYETSWPIVAEQSCEKIYPSYSSPERDHWRVCGSGNGFTPGEPNSVTLLDHNGILLNTIRHMPEYPTPEDSFQIMVLAVNGGRLPISGVVTIEQNDEEIASRDVSVLVPRDTTAVTIGIPPLNSGSQPLVLNFFVSGENFPPDNIAYDTVLVSFHFGTIRINEFLAIPDPDQVEFIELYNPDFIDLSGWGISGNAHSPRIFPSIFPEKTLYPVITGDSLFTMVFPDIPVVFPVGGLQSLNNTGAAIYVHDPTGNVVDSLHYTTGWPLLAGRSTEKFRWEYVSRDSSRWALCVAPAGATPGAVNSVYYDTLPGSGQLTLAPNPFSPDGDGHEDILNIQYRSPFASNLLTVQCYNILGRKIRTLAWRQAMPTETKLNWDGRDDEGRVCPMGIYIVRVLIHDQVSGDKWEQVKTVVLARLL